jgi:hypothetical protein
MSTLIYSQMTLDTGVINTLWRNDKGKTGYPYAD